MLTFTDMFCGAGGSSIGYTAAGMRLLLAANHWDRAIETHAANFPHAEHLKADVSNYDMRRLPSSDVLHASPICTELSPAGGRRRRQVAAPGQGDLLEEAGHVAKPAFERTRATFHDVIRATEVHRYNAVVVENVPDVAKWELFDWWVTGMLHLGYRVQYVSASSAHISGPGNDSAPQWRDRLYLVFTRTGIRLPDVAPRPLAFCTGCGVDVPAVQWWKKPGARTIGVYRRQYLYRCPNSACRRQVVEPYVRPAASVIDWGHLGQRIGDRSKPLAANTLRRIEAGLRAFGEPTVVRACGTDPQGSGYLRAWPASSEPLGTRVTSRSDGIATAPGMLVPSGGTWNDTASSLSEPMRTRTVRDMEAVVTPAGSFYVKNYGGFADPAHMAKPVSDPFGTITTSDHHGLVVPYYRTGRAKPAADPLDTVTTHDRFALITGQHITADDCHYRMLQPRESLRAQRFPDTYTVTGNQGEQTMQAGNAVSSNVTQWIGQQLTEVL